MSDIETGIGIGRQLQAIENRIMMQDKLVETLTKDLEEMYTLLEKKGLLTEK